MSRKIILLLILFSAVQLRCQKTMDTVTAFYYWKSTFNLDKSQTNILSQTAANNIYIRFFDIGWDVNEHKAYPNALINFKQTASHLNVTPVIYISNTVFDNISQRNIDSLAIHSNGLIKQVAAKQKIQYESIQIDCDWTLASKDKYFYFLKCFKQINHHNLQVTIRLHQIKYKGQTGVPPADKGVLMFYNMGKISSYQSPKKSIYNYADAAKYVNYIPAYPLKLDVALPLFSWALLIRNNKIIQVYEKIKRTQLNNPLYFKQTDGLYQAIKSFYLSGIYIKVNDIFKLEKIGRSDLQEAVKQLTENLPRQDHRTIIYYELGNLDFSEFTTEDLQKISADF